MVITLVTFGIVLAVGILAGTQIRFAWINDGNKAGIAILFWPKQKEQKFVKIPAEHVNVVNH